MAFCYFSLDFFYSDHHGIGGSGERFSKNFSKHIEWIAYKNFEQHRPTDICKLIFSSIICNFLSSHTSTGMINGLSLWLLCVFQIEVLVSTTKHFHFLFTPVPRYKFHRPIQGLRFTSTQINNVDFTLIFGGHLILFFRKIILITIYNNTSSDVVRIDISCMMVNQ